MDQSVQVYEELKAIDFTHFSSNETMYGSIFYLLWILEYQKK